MRDDATIREPLCQGCQMATFDAFLSLNCARVGSNFGAQRSGAIVPQAQRAKRIQSKNPAIAIWQPCLCVVIEQTIILVGDMI